MDDVSALNSGEVLGKYFTPGLVMLVSAWDANGNPLTEGAQVIPQLTPLEDLPEFEGLPVVNIAEASDNWQVSFPVREAEKDDGGTVTLLGPKGKAVLVRYQPEAEATDTE